MDHQATGKPQPTDDNWLLPSHSENRSKLPLEYYTPFIDKFVAWSWDGTHIVTSADSYKQLFEIVESMGIDPSHVVYSYVDPPDEICTGLVEFCDTIADDDQPIE